MSLFIPITFSQIQPLRDQGVTEIAILNVLRRVAIKYTPIIQRATPVDTGRLKASMRVELLLDRNGLAITSEVFYSSFVEFGTRKMRPRRFSQQFVPQIISEVLAGLSLLSDQPLDTNPPIRQFRNDENGLYSGQTTQQLSEKLISKVVGNLLLPRSVGNISVSSLSIEDERVEDLQIVAR